MGALRERALCYVHFGIEHPEHYRLLFMRKPLRQPKSFSEERIRAGAGFGPLVAGVERAMEDGELPAGDAFQVAIELWVLLHGITSLLISIPGFPWPDVDALVGRMLDVHVTGLRAGLAGAPRAGAAKVRRADR
jgi:hypothetical protein